jgi:formylglycine-generating enzyme required for sulfatase activity
VKVGHLQCVRILPADPAGPASGSHRVFRGGGWGSHAGNCRSANRLSGSPDRRHNFLGFRLSLVLAEKPNK